MCSKVIINILRALVFVSSALVFISHVAQCILFSEYQRQTGIRDWLTAGHWAYLLWYITLSLSIVCSLAVCIHAGCCRRSHIVRGDRKLSILNIITLTSTVLVITFLGGQEPWSDGLVEFTHPAKGFITYCGQLDAKRDALYPLLYQRCLLIDATYIGTGAACVVWIALLVSTLFVQRNAKRSATVAYLPGETDRKWHSMNSSPPSPTLSNILAAPQHSASHYTNPTPTLPSIYDLATADRRFGQNNQHYTAAAPQQLPVSYYEYQTDELSPNNYNPPTSQYVTCPPSSRISRAFPTANPYQQISRYV